MNKLICGLVMLASVSGCAAFQGAPSKVDVLQESIMCRLDLLKPYQAALTLDNLKLALAGDLDPVQFLEALDINTQDILAFKTGWEACVAAEKAPK